MLGKPSVRVRYELEEIVPGRLAEEISKVVRTAAATPAR
jgi:hypothetical protein